MKLPTDIRDLFQHEGPFATAYLDGSRSTEQGQREVELRWRALREQLATRGADDAILGAMSDAVDSDRPSGGRHGHLLVASKAGILLDSVSDEPPLRDVCSWGPLPHVLPYLARCADPVPYVLVVTDRTGATLFVNPGGHAAHLQTDDAEQVEGSHQPEHRSRRNDWSTQHFHNRIENTWTGNAADVAAAVLTHIRESHAELVLVAGEVRARALVMHALADDLPPGVELSETTAGGRGDRPALEPVEQAVHDAVLRARWRYRHDVLSRLRQGVARQDFAVTGLDEVLAAMVAGQIETLVISDDPTSTERAWLGPHPLQLARDRDSLIDQGVSEPQQDRLDAALVRAVAGSGAQLLITPQAHSYLRDGLGAVLRYPLSATS